MLEQQMYTAVLGWIYLLMSQSALYNKFGVR